MGKQNGKTKKQGRSNSGDSNTKQSKIGENSPKAYDKDTIVFISMSNELKDEGNRLFQKRDYEGAMLKYEKALKLLPRSHVDVSYLRSNMAACYMQMGLSEYPRAIHECNLALEVTPKYSKALLKRARCYEALNRLDLALRDCTMVLKMEPNNLMATEIAERVRTTIDIKGVRENKVEIDLVPVPEYVEPSKLLKEKSRKKKSMKIVEKSVKEEINEKKAEEKNEEKKGKENIEEIKAEEKIKEKKGEEKIKEKKGKEKIEQKKDQVKIKEKTVKMKNEEKFEEKKAEEKIEEKKAEDKLVVEEKISTVMEEEFNRTVKLVFAEDIRWAKIPPNCSILNLREVVRDRFPNSEAFLIKYRDQEGDLVTITTSEELRWAEALGEQHGSVRLYLVQVNPEQDPFYEKVKNIDVKQNGIVENGNVGKLEDIMGGGLSCIDDWIIQFAQLFKNYVGFNSDAYLDLHELGTKLYSEAMEEVVTSEEAQELFNTAADKFQEMAALALFNWGNVHMSRARKRVYFTEDSSRESVLSQIKIAYEWAKEEYSKAGERYEEALRIKPDFYEGVVALGKQQFEQAKLSWYYAIGTNVDIQTWPSNEVIQLYNSAEDNMEKGMQMWELAEEHRLNELSRSSKVKTLLQKMNLGGLIKDLLADEAAEQTANMRSQINLLWGTMLYERSIMEYKLGLPVWQECLEVAVEKFELAGASPTDVAVMMKNHCSNGATLEGLGFNIDEIVQAWNEMYEAKRWQSSVPSFRLEPLLRRRVSKLYHAFEHA